MARFYECDNCEHAQLVGVIDNGLPGGYADPDAVCENCGAVGKFWFAPGAARRLREQVSRMAPLAALPPNPEAFALLDRIAKGQHDA